MMNIIKFLSLCMLCFSLQLNAQTLGNVDTLTSRDQQTRVISKKSFKEVDDALLDTLFDLDWNTMSGYSDWSGQKGRRLANKMVVRSCVVPTPTSNLYMLSASITEKGKDILLRVSVATGACVLTSEEKDELYRGIWSTVSKSLFIQDLSLQPANVE